MSARLHALRQVALITPNLEASLRFWQEAFGLEECYRDDLSGFGLSNVLLPIGEDFLELLQVEDPGSSGARFLTRHGAGLYMAIFEGYGVPEIEAALAAEQVPVVYRVERPRWRGIHLHPRAMSGVLLSVEDPDEPGRWPAAGEAWQPHVRPEFVSGILGVELLTSDAVADAGRWERLFALTAAAPEERDGVRAVQLPIDASGTWVRFLQPLDGESAAARRLQEHGPGMYSWTLATPDLERTLARLAGHGVRPLTEERAAGGRAVWLDPAGTEGALTCLEERR